MTFKSTVSTQGDHYATQESPAKPSERLLTDIAVQHLGVTSLESSEAVPFNFHQVTLDGLKRALSAAYAAGAGSTQHATSDQWPLTFDAYEIHGVVEFKGEDGTRYCEPAPDKEAHFWSLYGHIPGQGLECIGDFKTREAAEEIYTRITGHIFSD